MKEVRLQQNIQLHLKITKEIADSGSLLSEISNIHGFGVACDVVFLKRALVESGVVTVSEGLIAFIERLPSAGELLPLLQEETVNAG